jgi:hypothetical protein
MESASSIPFDLFEVYNLWFLQSNEPNYYLPLYIVHLTGYLKEISRIHSQVVN